MNPCPVNNEDANPASIGVSGFKEARKSGGKG
jgi:hypothetical protein